MRRTLMGRVAITLAGTAAAAAVGVVCPSGTALAAQPTSGRAALPFTGAPTSAPAPAPAPSDAAPPRPRTDPNVAAERQARAQAAQRQRLQDRAAERQAHAQAAAEARAATLAAAGQRARAAWEERGQPNKLVVIRQRSVELVTAGRLTRSVPARGSAVTISTLSRVLPTTWLSIADGTARLSAAVVLNPGTSLVLGGDVTTVQLAGGPAPSDAASIYTGRGHLTVAGVTVTSSDAAFQQPMPAGPGRPFIAVTAGGRFDAADATISDLGTAPTDPADRAGLTLGEGSGGSIVRTSLLRNSTGLKLDRAVGVRLEALTVADSASHGLVLRGDQGTVMTGIEARHNGGNGVLVTGPSSDRPITGITTTGNALFGVASVGQTGPRVNGITADGDVLGALRVSWSTDVHISDLTAINEPTGVYTHVGSGPIVIDRLHVTGTRRGLQIEKTTRGLTVNDSTIEGASIAGISIGGHEVGLNRVTVKDSRTGVRVERGASEVTADGLFLSGGKDGVVALSATGNVVLKDVVTRDVADGAVRTASRDLQIIGGWISGSSTGVDAGAATTIQGTAITAVDTGIRVRTGDLVRIDGIEVSAVTAGINAAAGSSVVIADTHVDALEAVRGDVQLHGANQFSLPPLNLLGAVGIPLVLVALLLEQVQAVRQRSLGPLRRRRTPPVLRAEAV